MSDTPKRRGFSCPSCGVGLRILSTRARASGVVTRRRACPSCDYRVTTTERPAAKSAR